MRFSRADGPRLPRLRRVAGRSSTPARTFTECVQAEPVLDLLVAVGRLLWFQTNRFHANRPVVAPAVQEPEMDRVPRRGNYRVRHLAQSPLAKMVHLLKRCAIEFMNSQGSETGKLLRFTRPFEVKEKRRIAAAPTPKMEEGEPGTP
jgi:hypothetical protein